MTDRSSRHRSLAGLAAESVLLIGAIGLVLFWVIPTQIRGGGLGLSPAFLPTVCAVGITVLVTLDGLLRLRSVQRPIAYSAGWQPLLVAGGLSAAGAVLLDLGSSALCAAVILPLGSVCLGESRWPLVATVTVGVTACVMLLSR